MAETAVKTTVTELPESRVRVEAEVPSAEVERRSTAPRASSAATCASPGFRKGKVPPPVVIQRIGREAVLDEAVRGCCPLVRRRRRRGRASRPSATRRSTSATCPPRGEPLTFSIEVGVRPTAQLGDVQGRSRSAAPSREADEEAIDREVEALRERLARLDAVERPAEEGDFVTVDYVGTIDGEPFAGGEGRDQLIELGSGRLIPGFEEQLKGASAGDERHRQGHASPRTTAPSSSPGKDAEFAVTVKEVKAKQLPELDDELAEEAGLRHARRAARGHRRAAARGRGARIEAEFREAALDAAVAAATVEVPDALVDARAGELWDRMLHSLSHQGIDKEAYLRIAGRKEEDLLAEARPDAEQALRREAVVAAIIEAEGIEAVRRGGPRGARADRAARGHDAEEAARPPAVAGPPRRRPRGSSRARRSTSSPRPRRRSRSSRPRRARSCGRPRRREGARTSPPSSGPRAPSPLERLSAPRRADADRSSAPPDHPMDRAGASWTGC